MSKQKLTAAITSIAIVGTLVSPVAVFAQTNTTDIIANLLKQIQELQAKIVDLQTQQGQLRQQQQVVLAELVTTLKQGDRGENVKTLQALLAADPSIYPEGIISGYFGQLTAAAVRRFQKMHGLEQVGNVGPRTLAKLKEKLRDMPIALEYDDDDEGDRGKRPCVPPGHLIAPGWLRKHATTTQQILPLCAKILPPGIAKKIATTTPPAPPPPPPADTAAPTISGVGATNIGSTTATIIWTTNEAATSRVYYGTSSPLVLASAQSVTNTALVTSHSINLTGLATGTTYQFVVESKDAANNTAISSQTAFSTAAF